MAVIVRPFDGRQWEVVSQGSPAGLLFKSRADAVRMARWWAAGHHGDVIAREDDGSTTITHFA